MFQWILDLPRQVGHSTAACGKGRAHLVIASTWRQARQLKRDFGVEAASLTAGAGGRLDNFAPRAVVFDTDAVQNIVRSYEHQLKELRGQLDAIKELAQ